MRSVPSTTAAQACAATGGSEARLAAHLKKVGSGRGRCDAAAAGSAGETRRGRRSAAAERLCPPSAERAAGVAGRCASDVRRLARGGTSNRMTAAESADAPAALLGRLLEDSDIAPQFEAARNRRGGSPLWRRMLWTAEPRVVAAAVQGPPGCVAAELDRLADHRREEVAAAAAGHPQCPPATLERLADRHLAPGRWSPPSSVVAAVAGNANCPEDLFGEFLASECEQYLEPMAGNAACPSEVLDKIAVLCGGYEETLLAGNPNSRPRLLRELHAKEVWDIDLELAGNPSTPPDLRESLLDHDSEEVQEQARAYMGS